MMPLWEAGKRKQTTVVPSDFAVTLAVTPPSEMAVPTILRALVTLSVNLDPRGAKDGPVTFIRDS